MAARIPTILRSAYTSASPYPIASLKPTILPLLPTFTRQASTSSPFGLRAPTPEAHPLSYKDAAIPYRTVQLVDPVTNHLLEPQSLRSILNTYDQSTHTLVLVNIEKEIPLVKLINKIESRKKERISEDKAKLKKKLSIEEKEVQISWQSAKGDLIHKLNLSKTLLEKGDCRISIIFANRKKSESISENQKLEIINWFNQEIEEGGFGKKWKDDDKNKGLWILHFNPLDINRNELQLKVKDQELSKKKEKEEKKEARRKKEEERRAKSEARAAAKAQEDSTI